MLVFLLKKAGLGSVVVSNMAKLTDPTDQYCGLEVQCSRIKSDESHLKFCGDHLRKLVDIDIKC